MGKFALGHVIGIRLLLPERRIEREPKDLYLQHDQGGMQLRTGAQHSTGYNGDTKAEENGWETNILSCALGLYPDDALAPKWFDRLRAFAINCYSHVDDAQNTTVIDPEYDETTVQDLYIGKNLYDDYTLQNHNYFHTSYQNVVMQELGESHLALHLFQGGNPKWKTNALMHNNQKVMDEVLCRLALADGELAMPNGNDWSMFLYDQITSYTTAACFLRDPNALMLENLAYKHIKARQSTTQDGSWLLNSDIGPRRMGVEGHRVMMTYLMHELASTADMQATSWKDFSQSQEQALHLHPAKHSTGQYARPFQRILVEQRTEELYRIYRVQQT